MRNGYIFKGEIYLGHVIIKKCDCYDNIKIRLALLEIFNHLGGVDKYIRPGMKVALKPNLVRKKRPEDAATTHPALIKELSVIIKEAGGEPIIIESPGGLFTRSALKGVYSVCGIEKAAMESGATLNYNLEEIVINNPEGKYLKKVTVVKALIDTDLIINLPKLKTHGQMFYTGAVKNMFGAVPGELKAEYHFRMSEYNDFADALIDIYLSVKPTLNIMDAIVGMEGEGPASGTPINIGLIIAGEDAFDVDFTALNIINKTPDKVPVINQGIKRGLCPDKIDLIKLSGELLESVKVNDFHMPQLEALHSVLFFSNDLTKKFMSKLQPIPKFNHKLCIGCTVCKNVCPAQAISMKDKKPYVDIKKCIRCFCCQELCPESAVYIKRPIVLDLLIKKLKKGRTVSK